MFLKCSFISGNKQTFYFTIHRELHVKRPLLGAKSVVLIVSRSLILYDCELWVVLIKRSNSIADPTCYRVILTAKLNQK